MAKKNGNKKSKSKNGKRLRYNHGALKMREQFNLETDASGNIQGQINSHSLTNFFRNSVSQAYIPLQEVGSVTALYDQYRPVGIKIQFIPRVNQIPGAQDSPVTMPSIAWAYDLDNGGTITYGNLLTRNQCTIKGFDKKWSLYYKVPHVSVSNSTNPSMVGGWNNLQSESAYTVGGVKFATEEGIQQIDPLNPPAKIPLPNYKLGSLLVTYYLEVKERQ